MDDLLSFVCRNQIEVEGEHFIILKDQTDQPSVHPPLAFKKKKLLLVVHFVCVRAHFVVSVTAEVRGPELHVARKRYNTVATLCCILLCDGIHARLIWKRVMQFSSFSKPVLS